MASERPIQIRLLDSVRLRDGRHGTVVEVLSEDAFMVDFSDYCGHWGEIVHREQIVEVTEPHAAPGSTSSYRALLTTAPSDDLVASVLGALFCCPPDQVWVCHPGLGMAHGQFRGQPVSADLVRVSDGDFRCLLEVTAKPAAVSHRAFEDEADLACRLASAFGCDAYVATPRDLRTGFLAGVGKPTKTASVDVQPDGEGEWLYTYRLGAG